MTAAFVPQTREVEPNGRGGVPWSIAIALTVWFALVLALGAYGAFVGPPGRPPLPIAMAVAAPLLLFWGLLRYSSTFHEFVLSLDLRLITGIQAWRWAGLEFLTLYAYKILPAVFAFPAGLGDMTIGVTAPWMVMALLRQPGFATRPAFIRWNLLGIVDLAVALVIGTLSALATTGIPGEVSTAPMSTLPLLLIPAFFVPIFLMLHIAALLQSRQLAQGGAA